MSSETSILEEQKENIQESIEFQNKVQEEVKKKPNILLWIIVFILVITNVLTVVYFIYANQLKPVAIVIPEVEESIQEEPVVVIDSDGDGLSDLIEDAIGTDKNKIDTDGDGYCDKEEYDKGYDPLVNQISANNDKKVTKKGKDSILNKGDIMVEWNEWPGKVSDYQIFDREKLTKLFEEKDVKNMDSMGGDPQTPLEFLETVSVLNLGSIVEGSYQGKELFIIFISPRGPGGNLVFRIIKNDDELIVLNNHSNILSDWHWYKDLFLQSKDINIVNIEAPSNVSYVIDGKNISLSKNNKEPNMLMTDVSDFIFLFEVDGKKYYKNNLTGCIFTSANDGTVREYFYDLDFIEKKESISGLVPRHLNITWLNGERNIDDYITNSYFGCGRAGCYQYASYLKDISQLVEVGETSTRDKIYELKNIDTKKADDDENSILREIFKSAFMGDDKEDYNEFVNNHPLIYWQTPFGDFIEFRNANYQPMAECGKPVIYLYPEEGMDIRVYVEPSGGFTVTEPAYGNGWKVKAKPNGELYNYSDKTIYPYLFWEGYAHDYFRPEKGFVVARENVEEFLVEKLTLLGLVEHEYNEFIEFWLSKMQDRNYYFVTFMPKEDFDVIAPLSVYPEPDTVIRVFMDYEGLDNYMEVEEQNIVIPERIGFTVVEWGGALHK